MTADDARLARDRDVAKRREAERLCALDFLTWGDMQGIHSKRCVRPAGLICSREYNPGPAPEDEALYEGTPLGALWGLNEFSTHDARQMAGWNLTRRKDTA